VNVNGAAWRPDSGALAFVANEFQRDDYNWVIGHTTRFAAAISGAGISNWISEEKRQPGRIRGPMACSTQPTMGCPTRSTTTTRHTVATPLCKA